MTAKTIDARLRKVEQRVGNTALAHLSDEALDARLREALDELSRPYDDDLVATRDALALGPDPEDGAIAAHLAGMIESGHILTEPELTADEWAARHVTEY